jgi:hypothetical protein
MPNFGMAEVFGIRTGDVSPAAWAARATEQCPYTLTGCSKLPTGICSIESGSEVAITCPKRFREGSIVYRDAAATVFGPGEEYVLLGEVPFLRAATTSGRAVGNIDNVLVSVKDGRPVDWCALEVQAVYFSGQAIVDESRAYFRDRLPVSPGSRRPDYRSSSAKRLLPQLEVKVPVLSRWGKKMVVVIDAAFFRSLPAMTEANDISNADILWLIYKLEEDGASRYRLALDRQLLTTLAETRSSLVGGFAPPRAQFENELTQRLARDHGIAATF